MPEPIYPKPKKHREDKRPKAGTPNACPPPKAHEPDFKNMEHAKAAAQSRHTKNLNALFRHRLRAKALPRAISLIERALAVKDEDNPLSGWADESIPIGARIECARMVIEHCLGKPKQAIEIEGKPNLALVRIESAQIAVVNAAGLPALPDPHVNGNGVAH